MGPTRHGWLAALGAALLLAGPARAYDEAALAGLEGNPICDRCDLSGADLSGKPLDDLIFIEAYMPGADFSRSSLAYSILSGANLRGALFRDADLSDADFSGANLDGADLSGAIVDGADFSAASMAGTWLTGVDMSRAFRADLSKVFGYAPPKPPPQPQVPSTPRPDLRVGSTFLVAFGYCPLGSTEAAGATWQIEGNGILYSLYQTRHGGDGRTTFKLPDLRQQVPLAGMRFCIVTVGAYPERP